MFSSLMPDTEIEEICTAVTWTSMGKLQLTTEGISPQIFPYFNGGSP